ncbi:MAG: class I SAM-dependent methyltransferase [Chloroflexi bacterium]|nr:class I SAM-dependent methyltransferase [Chloroflexota bacterium]MCH8340169.1 class I SAM-dependent methyltransferase [Chloroflexota bacterium]MCI0862089.1 class I SAM-dependent methyltransferase [Chloroflexota bacterium]
MSEPQTPVCDYEGSDYQKRFWDLGDRAYEDAAEATALRRLLPSAGEYLLELGAGAGRHSPRYKGYGRVALLDYSLSQLNQARSRLGAQDRYDYVVGDVYSLPFKRGAFDSATMIRVIHHMADPQAALVSVRRVLGSGASFILEYANKRNLKAILRWISRRQSWNPFDPDPVEFVELNFNFHPGSVRTWLQISGFTVERQLAVSHFRLQLAKRLIPLRILVAADSALQPIGRWIRLSPSVFVLAHAKAT